MDTKNEERETLLRLVPLLYHPLRIIRKSNVNFLGFLEGVSRQILEGHLPYIAPLEGDKMRNDMRWDNCMYKSYCYLIENKSLEELPWDKGFYRLRYNCEKIRRSDFFSFFVRNREYLNKEQLYKIAEETMTENARESLLYSYWREMSENMNIQERRALEIFGFVCENNVWK